MILLFKSAASTMQKIKPVGCFMLYIYFLLFQENHQNRISRAGEKIGYW